MSLKKIQLLIAVCLLTFHSLGCLDYNWNGTTSTAWSIDTNWTPQAGSPVAVPGAGDNVAIINVANTCTVDGAFSIVVVDFVSGALLGANGDSSILTISGGITVGGNSSIITTVPITFAGATTTTLNLSSSLTIKDSIALRTSNGNSVTVNGVGDLIIDTPHVYDIPTLTMTGDFSAILSFPAATTITAGNEIVLNGGSVLSLDNDFTGNFAGLISGAGSVVLNSTGATAILTGDNIYSGGTTVTAGTLQGITGPAGAGISIPAAGDVAIATGATFALNQATNVTLSGVMSGDGAFTKLGVGILTLSGVNTYTGATAITGGDLVTTVIATSGDIAIGAGLDLQLNQPTAVTYVGAITGTGTLEKIGAGTLTLSGDNTYTGATTITAGNLITTVIGTSGATDIGAGLTLTLDQPTAVTYAGAITGTGGILTKIGAGTLTLSGDNTYTGATTITAGNLITTVIATSGATAIGAGLTLTLNQPTDVTYGGIISGGTGILTKTGAGNLTLSATNTYGGLTTVSAGTLTGAASTSIPLANDVAIASGATFQLNLASGTGDFSGVISDVTTGGAFTKLGTGNLTLSGAKTYTGLTTVSAGTLTVPMTIPLTNNVAIASGATFQLNLASGTGDFSGVISDVTTGGAFTKLGAGNLTLSGTNTYTGLTTVSEGTLTGTTDSIPSAGGVAIASGQNLVLDKDQNTYGTYSGVISGAGNFTKDGKGYVTLSGINTYTGTTTVTEGELLVTGTIAAGSTTTVEIDAILRGKGSVGPVVNKGLIEIGSLPGDIFDVNGNYTQVGDTSAFTAFIGHDIPASKLTVTGTAALGNVGTLQILAAPGAYLADTTFTLIEATEITGDFAIVVPPSGDELWQSANTGTTYTLTVVASHLANIPAIESFPRNPRNVGLYFFDDGVAFESEELRGAANAALDLPVGGPLEEALIRLSPLTQSGNINANFQNNVQMAIVLDRQFQNAAKNHSKKSNKCAQLQYAQPQSGGFVQPIALFYNQDQRTDSLATTQQIAFNASTYGVGIGYNYVLDNQYILEGGIGYTYSTLNWKRDFGGSSWNSLYLAPFFGWFNDQAFANIMLMWAANFYDTNRKIQFPGFTQTANSNYNSYDFLIRANGGFQAYLGNNYWIRPEFTLNYLVDIREKYTESGAGGISLVVKQQVSNILQPSVRARFIKEMTTPKFCYSPNVYVGWLANVPLDNGAITARFTDAPSNLFFSIQGGNQTTNQLVVGAEFFARRFDQFEVTSNFEADLLSHFQIYTVKVKFEWMF